MDLFYEVINEYYKKQNDKTPIIETATCKHEFTDIIDYQVACLDCGEISQEPIFMFDYNKRYNRQSRKCAPHSTEKYFIKFLNKLPSEAIQDYWLLTSDFEEQETVLKEVLQQEGKRRNSLNVKYKLYKLLQRRQKFYSAPVKLPKCHKTIIEHDRIMKEVWKRLNWDWIETM